MKRNTRIDSIKYYGIIGMCLLHSSYLLSEMHTKISIYSLIQCGGGTCLPLYFFLSAFFFSCNFSPDHADIKLTSRVKSIMIPFFFWNLFFIEIYAILGNLQQHINLTLTHETYFPSGVKETARFIWLGYRNPPLWYLQILTEFVLISPALYTLCKKYKKISILVLTQLLLINLIFYGEIKYASITYWSPVYGAGLWSGIYIPSYILEYNKKTKYSFASCITFFAFIFILYTFPSNPYINYFKYCFWMFIPVLLLEISYILPDKKFMRNLYDAQFLIFCLHYPLIQFLDAFTDNFFIPKSNIQIFIKWFLIVILTLVIIHIVYYLIKNFMEPLYKFFYGKY